MKSKKYNFKKHKKHKKHKKFKKSKKNYDGGRALGAGTYGCVFKPKLTCKEGEKNEAAKDLEISKLMMKDTADEEMVVFENIKDVIDDVHENWKYFIPNSKAPYVTCRPGPQTPENLENLKACKNLDKKFEIKK